MATKQQAMKAAAALGVTVEKSETVETVTLDAPAGHILNSSGCHCAVIAYQTEFGDRMADVWGHVLDELRYGIAKCDDPNCDVCNEVETCSRCETDTLAHDLNGGLCPNCRHDDETQADNPGEGNPRISQ